MEQQRDEGAQDINVNATNAEAARLLALARYQILDTPAEEQYDMLVDLASQICETPIALVSLVDANRQWFKARKGLDAEETPRDIAFCNVAIGNPEEVLVVADAARDPRFKDNPLVTQAPNIRFYAGAPVLAYERQEPLGTLCVIDTQPRELSDAQIGALKKLARLVSDQLELERRNRELTSANERLTEFAHLAAHDLRAPLRHIRLYSEFLEEDADLAPEQTKSLQAIKNAADNMNRLTQDILDYSLVGQSSLQPEWVNMRQLFCAVLAEAEHNWPDLRTHFDVAETLPDVFAQRSMMRALVQNLVENAFKYAVVEGSIHITVAANHAARGQEFWVADRGPGIAHEDVDNAFKPFRRLRNSDSIGTGTGAGIGLASCQRIVEIHGGRIWVENGASGGAVFKFSLPVTDDSQKGAGFDHP